MSVLVIKHFTIGCMNLVLGTEGPPDVHNSLQHTTKLVWSLLRNTNIARATLAASTLANRCLYMKADESRFLVSGCDRRVRVWRRQGERYAECNIMGSGSHCQTVCRFSILRMTLCHYSTQTKNCKNHHELINFIIRENSWKIANFVLQSVTS